MALTLWGILEKSQIDSETIEEAIARLIQAHEDDPNAHLEIGESLQSHKAAAIIDHLANSIIADKILDWIDVKLSGNFERNDFHWRTLFESIDGFGEITNGGGTATIRPSQVDLQTGAVNNDYMLLYKEAYPTLDFTWAKKKKARFTISFLTKTNQTIWLGIGSETEAANKRRISFKIINDAAWGLVHNATDETLLDLNTAIDIGFTFNFKIVFVPGEYAEFFINGVSKGKIETDLPTGFISGGYILSAKIKAQEAANKRVYVHIWDFWTEA